MKFKQNNLEFIEKGHFYLWEGQPVPGVTEILKARNKEFLMWWTAKEAVRYLKDKLAQIKEFNQEQWEALLDEAKKAWTVKSGKAKDSGQTAHSYIESYIGKKLGTMGAEIIPEDKEAKNAVEAFLRWEAKTKPEWIVSEMSICGTSGEYRYAGTFDFLARIDGKLTLGDFKTSNQFSDEYPLQIAAYWQGLNQSLEDNEERPTERLILRLPKDGTDAEEWRIKTNLDFDIRVFNSVLAMNRWNLYFSNHFMENGKITK